MAICSGCGNTVPDNQKFCVACGKPVTPGATTQIPVQPAPVPAPPPQPVYRAPAAQQPTYAPPALDQPPPKGSRWAVLGVGSYLGTFLLFCIPLVGFIICIVFACGGTKYQNKRNFARAFLILTVIMVVIAVLMALLFQSVIGWLFDSMQQLMYY